MGDDRVERRGVLGGAVGLLASLAGCGGLFIEPESTATPDAADRRTPTPTPTPTPTSSPASTPTSSPASTTAAPLPSDVIEVRNRRFSLRPSKLATFTEVDYYFQVENVGRRPIEYLEFRVAARYDHAELSRVVGTGYHRSRFDLEGDDGGSETRPGLQPDEVEPVRGSFRFERDGRAERSSDADRFVLELSLRRIRYR
ncbi:MAG: hypothetical protein ABEH58_06755 [Haloplanus sp.]